MSRSGSFMKDVVELGRGRAPTSNAELLKWLDRHQKAAVPCNSSTNPDHEVGFVSIVYQTCLQLFGEMWKSFIKDQNRPRAWQAHTRENLTRLALWGDLFEHGRLDACLDRSTEIRDCVLEALHDIGKTLIEGASKLEFYTTTTHAGHIKEQLKDLAMLLEKVNSILGVEDGGGFSSDTEASETEKTLIDPNITFDKDMHLHITCLEDLTQTLERMVKDANLAGEDPIVGPHSMTFHVTESAKQYVLQVHDKFRNAPKALVERLGEANWQRFMRIRSSMQKQEQEVAENKTEPATAKSAFAPVSKFHDSGLGSSVLSRSRIAASVASHSSFASSQADSDVGKLRVPPTPEKVGLGLPFECFICGLQQSKIKNRVDWKIHVFEDLQPYICTFDGCRDLLVTFSTRKLWSEHEFSEHRVDRFLKCHDCFEDFKNEYKFIQHLRHGHGNRASGSQLSAIVTAAKTSRPTAVNSQQCPLCFQDGWTSQRNFATHVGRHMEDIALACLPKDADDNEESSDGEDNLQVPMIQIWTEAGSQTSSPTQSQASAKSEPANLTLSVEDEYTIKCICTYTDDDGNTVYCEDCDTWQHINCYYPDNSVPELHFCRDCRPRPLDGKEATTDGKEKQKHPATYSCHLCTKRFKYAYNLRSHLRTHNDERPFVCTVCGKAFARQHERKRHEGLHSGEKRFVCKGELESGNMWGCGRRFARADALGRHFRSEAGRVCIKPLLDKEAAERVGNQMLEQQQTENALGVGDTAFPPALLAQYPALGDNVDWPVMPQD